MEIIRGRERKTHVSYSRVFDYEDDPGAGFGFDCDSDGNLLNTKPEAIKNFVACLTGSVNGEKVIDRGVQKFVTNYTEPAVGRCHCGAEVVLANFTNTCDKCGRDYNWNGSLLASRSQWGEETREPWYECY